MTSKNLWENLLLNEENSPLTELFNSSLTVSKEVQKISISTFERQTANNGCEKGEKGFQYNIQAVSKIIDLCYENEIIPVLVSTPQVDELNAIYAKTDFFDMFYRFTDVLQEMYPKLIYLDYSQNAEYSSDYSLFFDVTHLNKKGAKKFTAQIVKDLKKTGLMR